MEYKKGYNRLLVRNIDYFNSEIIHPDNPKKKDDNDVRWSLPYMIYFGGVLDDFRDK